VGCSSGLIDCGISGSLRSRLSGIVTCHGDSCHFPVLGEGCDSFQVGPSSRTNSLCFSTKGMVRMGGIHGVRGDDAIRGEGSISGESSFRFPMMGGRWYSSQSSGVGLSLDNILESGCLGSKGLVRLSVIETMGGNSDGIVTGDSTCGSEKSCDDDATGGDGCGVILGKGGISHGRGMESSEEGAVHLTGGNGTLSICWVTGINIGKDGGKGTLTGSSVSSIGIGGLYCSIDEYSCRCDPQGTRGSGGDAIRGDSTGGRLEGMGIGTNGDRSTRGGDGTLGTIGGNGIISFGKDDDG